MVEAGGGDDQTVARPGPAQQARSFGACGDYLGEDEGGGRHLEDGGSNTQGGIKPSYHVVLLL